MAVIWNAETVRRVAIGICNTEGITVTTVDTPGFVPNANPDRRSIELGPFNILNSKEYIWHMYHEIGHLFPENLWHWDSYKIIRGRIDKKGLHVAALSVLNVLADYLADKSRLKDYRGRDRALSEGLYEYLRGKPKFIEDWSKTSPLIASMYGADLHMRGAWQLEMPYGIPDSIEHIFEAIIDFKYEERLELCTKPKELVKLVEDLMTLASDADKKKQQQQQKQGNQGKQQQGQTGKTKSDVLGNEQEIKDKHEKGKADVGRLPEVEDAKFDVTEGSSYVPKDNWAKVDTRDDTQPHSSYVDEINEALKDQNISRNLRKYLVAMNQRAYTGGKTKGKIHQKNIHRIFHSGDNPKIFRQRDAKRIETSSAFMIVNDCSGSMSGVRHIMASACNISCIETCQNLRIPSASRGYSDRRSSSNQDIIFKNFDEPPISREILVDRFSSSKFDMNINADGESIVKYHEIIYNRPERNKIMVVLSDGSPTGGSGIGNKNLYLREVAHHIHYDSPVTLIGIGIMTDSVNAYYVNAHSLFKLSELEPLLASILKGSFLK